MESKMRMLSEKKNEALADGTSTAEDTWDAGLGFVENGGCLFRIRTAFLGREFSGHL